jgi:Asp-tRNA(Asn)/Glu-tRNA(Gln) amidotransferase A subunit family amidase
MEQGMVMLGKTNVSLMAGDVQSYSDLFSTSNNPWDLKRIPGSSTEGEFILTAGSSSINEAKLENVMAMVESVKKYG